MSSISLEEAQSQLPALIHRLTPGQELVITENNQPVAQVLPAGGAATARILGTMRGTVSYMAPDFDAPLEDFKDYSK